MRKQWKSESKKWDVHMSWLGDELRDSDTPTSVNEETTEQRQRKRKEEDLISSDALSKRFPSWTWRSTSWRKSASIAIKSRLQSIDKTFLEYQYR